VRNSNISAHFGVGKVRLAWELDWTGWNWSGMPSVGPDGTIYLIVNYRVCCHGDQRGELLAVSPQDGSVIWSAALIDSFGLPLIGGAAPIITPEGNIHLAWLYEEVHEGDDELLVVQAFDRDGNLLWDFEEVVPLSGGGAGMLAPDGTLYQVLSTAHTAGGNEHSSMFAFDSATGELKWRLISPNQDHFFGRPVLGNDGKLYFASAEFAPFGYDGYLYRIDPATGEIEWSVSLGQRGAGAPLTIDPDGNLYLVNGRCVKYDAQGNVLWTYDDTDLSRVRSSAVVDNGRVYLAVCCSGEAMGVHVLDAETGERLDILERGGFIGRAITLDRSGNVYFFDRFDMLAYNPAGEFLWRIYTNSQTSAASLIIGHDGLIVTTTPSLSAFGSSVLVGDLNCDGAIDAFDIEPYLLILFDPETYAAEYPKCDGQTAGDINVDGSVNAFDIEPFLELLFP
jgi:outer membrane protein assembly factor BamB